MSIDVMCVSFWEKSGKTLKTTENWSIQNFQSYSKVFRPILDSSFDIFCGKTFISQVGILQNLWMNLKDDAVIKRGCFEVVDYVLNTHFIQLIPNWMIMWRIVIE